MQVQNLGSLHVFDVLQHTCQILNIVPVYGAEVADVHSFEDVLLLGGYRLQAVAKSDEGLAAFFVQNPHFEQKARCLEPQLVIAVGSSQVEQILLHASHAAVDGHIVVVQDDKQIVGGG